MSKLGTSPTCKPLADPRLTGISQCIHSLPGHTSTIRCIKVLPHRAIAVSGSRDYTLRVWDIHRGRCLHTLRGHTKSVRCVEVWGNMAVSGSYDNTAKVTNPPPPPFAIFPYAKELNEPSCGTSIRANASKHSPATTPKSTPSHSTVPSSSPAHSTPPSVSGPPPLGNASPSSRAIQRSSGNSNCPARHSSQAVPTAASSYSTSPPCHASTDCAPTITV